MLSKILGPQRLRHLAGLIIFGMLSAVMIQKAYITPAPIDRAQRVQGELTAVEPLVRTIKGKDQVKSLRLRIKDDDRGFLIFPGVFATAFDRAAFEQEGPIGSQIAMEVRAERLPVIYSLSTSDKVYITKEVTRAHVSGRTTFLRVAAIAPVLVALFSLFQLVRGPRDEIGSA